MKISLIHPSRSRPEKAKATARKWIELAGVPVEHIFSVDNSDPKGKEYFEVGFTTLQYPNESAVDAINRAAAASTGDILMVLSDDFVCPENWGFKVIEQTKGKTDWIAKTPDGIQKWIITMPIMDRAYYNRFGYVYYPEYKHMFCDTDITCVADITDRKIELNIPFVHEHYSIGKSQKDEVSIRADATWSQGEKLFIERAKRKFDLTETPGTIKSQEYLNWLRMKGV